MTYLDMQDRIVEETRRTDFAGALVQDAIQDAIRHFKDEAFLEVQATTTSSTVADTQTVALPTDFSSLVTLQITDQAGNVLQMEPMTMEEMNSYNLQTPPFTELPQGYTIFGALLYLWPVPDRIYTLTWFYNSNLAAPDDDTDEGFWMNEASRMVRCYAKGVLWSDVAYNNDWAQAEFSKAKEEFSRMFQRAEAAGFESGIRPYP